MAQAAPADREVLVAPAVLVGRAAQGGLAVQEASVVRAGLAAVKPPIVQPADQAVAPVQQPGPQIAQREGRI